MKGKQMKSQSLILASTLLLAACGSVKPYQEPAADQPSANLTILLGRQPGEATVSYARPDEEGCLEFPPLQRYGNDRYQVEKNPPVPKTVKIPAGTPQIIQYYRQIGRNASAQTCSIALKLTPKQGVDYVLTTSNSYKTRSEKNWLGFESTNTTESCIVYLLEMDADQKLAPADFKRVFVAPSRFGVPGCPRATN